MRWLALAALALAAGLAPGVAWRHHARARADEAVRRLATWRVAGTTHSRVDAWLARTHPAAPLTWAATPPGPFDDEVAVWVTVAGVAYHFAFDPAAAQIHPRDAAAEGLVAAIRAEANGP